MLNAERLTPNAERRTLNAADVSGKHKSIKHKA